MKVSRCNPSTPLYCNPSTPLYCNPSTPLYCNPGTPLYCNPSTPCILTTIASTFSHPQCSATPVFYAVNCLYQATPGSGWHLLCLARVSVQRAIDSNHDALPTQWPTCINIASASSGLRRYRASSAFRPSSCGTSLSCAHECR
jgi:hypothetical protein